ncbi:phage portal protein family protein [Phocaeicola vulgatus]|uniref:phage portal protein family protein n=1 Tax=Phocaeicola vulgatus TaxID=821 RepID=UPI003F64CF6F
MVVNLQRTTDALTRKDIQDWRNAWQLAINVDSPNRKPLYDIYRDVDADLHLSGCIEQRKGFVMSRSFKIVGADGKEVEDAAHYFNQAWFRQLMKLSLDSVYWGHSLIELGDIVTDGDGCICYDGVKLIPRKHVIPEYGRVVTDLGQDWTTGLEYRRAPFTDWLIEAGQPDDLGLFLKAATQTIPKKNALAFWDTFAEIFGMPMRIAKTTTRDEKELAKMEKMMDSMGASLWGVFQEGTEIEVVESTKGDAFNVYDKRVDRANSELSKLIIGQTMTIEDGSSLSQSQTHLEVFENLVESDRTMLADCFCLVASDGDYTLLAQRIREAGLPVLGYGEGKTPAPLVRACTEFLYADRMEGKPVENTPGYFLRRDMEYFDRAFEEAADGKTEVPLSLIGTALKRMMPKFKIKRYGCKTLGKLYEKLDRYELVRTEKGVAGAVRLKR